MCALTEACFSNVPYEVLYEFAPLKNVIDYAKN